MRRRATVSVTNKLDAEMKFFTFKAEVLEAHRVSQEPAGSPQTAAVFGPWVREHWSLLSANMSERTASKNWCTVATHVIPFFGELLIRDVTENLIEDFRGKLLLAVYGPSNKRYSAAFINDCLRQLHAILVKACKRKALDSVPSFPKALKEAKPSLELSREEEEALLAAFDDKEAYLRRFGQEQVRGSVSREAGEVFYSFFRSSKPFFVTALHTGLRRGDLLNLEWAAVNLNAGHIRLVTTKTKTPVLIPLSDTALRALGECRDRAIASTKWVFVQHDGSRMSLTTLRRHFSSAKELAGIQRRFRIHDLRHTAASKMASAGVPLQVIARILGHSSTRMSERYARPDDAALLQVREAMEGRGVQRFLNSNLNSKPGFRKARTGR